MPLDTPACNQSEGILFLGQDCEAKAFIRRMNKVSEAFCSIKIRIENAAIELNRYCPYQEPSSSSFVSSSSSSTCNLGCAPGPEPDKTYWLSVNHLNQDAYEAINLLEEETCSTFRLLINLENEIKNGCQSSSSSLPSSSNPPSSSSSPPSSSSAPPPSSSSSSSSTIACPSFITILSYCPTLPFIPTFLEKIPNSDPLYSDCYYSKEPTPPPVGSSSSSLPPTPSSSSTPPSSSSSSSHASVLTVRYNIALERWEVYSVTYGLIAYRFSASESNPRGVYAYAYPGCSANNLIIS